jgi:tRNA pseudouridine32 synthase/23S rRNA pseudouridine746 synthase
MLHRLDFGTSGVMLVALNKVVNASLTKQFQAQTIEKSYTAILHGDLLDEKGCIDLPVAKGTFPLQVICHTKGKQAISHYQVIERFNSPSRTKVMFTPMTGRTHQLRIHSQAIGFPILGCDLYATDEAYFMADRLMLHATTLGFDHPVTGKRIIAQCPCPF